MGEKVNTATTYRLRVETLDQTIVCPILANDTESMLLAVEWAGSLVRHTGLPVKVFRGHMQLIEIPAG